jgi:phosphoglycolate phosphatase
MKLPAYRLLIFDFDGTLADSFPWFISMINRLAENFRFRKIELDQVETLRNYSAREMIRRQGIRLWKLPFIAAHVRKQMARRLTAVLPFKGTDALLRRLEEHKFILALVTSNSRQNVRAVLGKENTARFTYMECGASIFGKKRMFKKVLRKSGVPPEAALCIGDELRDLEAAKKAGLPFGAVAWGYNSLAALQTKQPDLVFKSMEEIGELSKKDS